MQITIEEVKFGSDKHKAILGLRNEILRKPLGMQLSEKDQENEDKDFHIAAFEGDKIIGCVLLRPINGKTIKLRQMAVCSSCQGQGVGAKIVAYAEEFIASRGFATIELHARKVARFFYEKLGYKTKGDEFLEINIPHVKMIKETRFL